MNVHKSQTSMQTPQTVSLLTVEEAAARMGTPPRFVRRLIAERRIRFCHVGRYVRLASEDIEDFIDRGWVDAGSGSHRPRRR